MKLHYYPETDSLYIELKAGPGSETREVAPGVNADFAADGTIVGLDIEGASRLDLGTLEAIDVPLTALRAAEYRGQLPNSGDSWGRPPRDRIR